MAGGRLNFCLAKTFVKQHFLLNSFMKLGHIITYIFWASYSNVKVSCIMFIWTCLYTLHRLRYKTLCLLKKK